MHAGCAVGLLHAVKVPLMLALLRDVVALGKGAMGAVLLLYQEVFLWSHFPVWKSLMQKLRTLFSCVGFRAAVPTEGPACASVLGGKN